MGVSCWYPPSAIFWKKFPEKIWTVWKISLDRKWGWMVMKKFADVVPEFTLEPQFETWSADRRTFHDGRILEAGEHYQTPRGYVPPVHMSGSQMSCPIPTRLRTRSIAVSRRLLGYRKQIPEMDRELDRLKNLETLSWELDRREEDIALRRERQERIEQAYAARWELMMPRLSEQHEAFVIAIVRGASPELAFQRVFGRKPDALEAHRLRQRPGVCKLIEKYRKLYQEFSGPPENDDIAIRLWEEIQVQPGDFEIVEDGCVQCRDWQDLTDAQKRCVEAIDRDENDRILEL
jgi:hypothetical protein